VVLVREGVAHKQGRKRRKRKKEEEGSGRQAFGSLVFCLRDSLSLFLERILYWVDYLY